MGANINAQDNRGRTPLYQSLKPYRSYLSNDVLKSLLKNNADLNVTTYKDKTILQQALTHTSPEAVHRILTKLYDEYPKDVYPSGPVETGEDKKRKTSEIAKFLLSREIDLYYPDSEYSLLLHFVLRNGDEETFKLVLHGGKFFYINALGPQQNSLLQWALYIDESFVNCIIDFGADVNLQGDDGETALHIATDYHKPRDKVMIRYLLDQGADVNSKTAFDKYTPLHNALVVGNEEIVEMILNAGADVGAKFLSDSYGKRQLLSTLNIVCGATSFKQSSFKNKAEVVLNEWTIAKPAPFFDKKFIKLLLERSTDRNIAALMSCKDENNLTPLQHSCKEGHFEIVKLLLKYGADIHSKDSEGNTLFHHAVSGKNENKEILDFLIRKGLNINSQNINMETALCQVALRRPEEAVPIIEFLTDNGAYLNSPKGQKTTFSGWTPLHLAVIHDTPELVECLLELKADFKAQDRDGKSPFDIQKENMPGLPKSAEVLIAFMTTDHVFPVLEHDISSKSDYKTKFLFSQFFRIEVARMRAVQICDERNISFFQFLTDDLLNVTFFAKYGQLMQVLETGVYKTEFPVYAFLLEKRIGRVKDMLRFTESVENLIQKYAERKLPSLVIHHIFSYLSVGDFRNAARALSVY